MRSYMISILLISLSHLSACSCWVENRAAMQQYAPENTDISPDLVKANISATDYSSVVHIMRGKVQGNSLQRSMGGYVNHIYEARVIETLKGQSYENITFSVMAESDIDPFLPDYPVIVSLCGKGPDAMYVPDNGYELPATQSLTTAARDFARKMNKSAPSRSICPE